MSRISPKKRKMQIKQSQLRRKKLAKLRASYIKAQSSMEKEKIIKKVEKIAPSVSQKEFIADKKA